MLSHIMFVRGEVEALVERNRFLDREQSEECLVRRMNFNPLDKLGEDLIPNDFLLPLRQYGDAFIR